METIEQLHEKIKQQEILIDDLKASARTAEAKFDTKLNEERDRVQTLRVAFRSNSESSAAAFEDMKENIETLRGQLERKRIRIVTLEKALDESYSTIERLTVEATASPSKVQFDLKPGKMLTADSNKENASSVIESLQLELNKERSLVAELKMNANRGVLAATSAVGASGQRSPQSMPYDKLDIVDNDAFRSPQAEDFVSLLLETERANINALQQKAHEVGGSNMYVDGYLDAWRVQVDDKLKSRRTSRGSSVSSNQNTPEQGQKLLATPSPGSGDFKGLMKKFVSLDVTSQKYEPILPSSMLNADTIDLQTRVNDLIHEIASKDNIISNLNLQISTKLSMPVKIDEAIESGAIIDSREALLQARLDSSHQIASDEKVMIELNNTIATLEQQIERLTQILGERDKDLQEMHSITQMSTAASVLRQSELETELTSLNLQLLKAEKRSDDMFQAREKLCHQISCLTLQLEEARAELEHVRYVGDSNSFLMKSEHSSVQKTIESQMLEISNLRANIISQEYTISNLKDQILGDKAVINDSIAQVSGFEMRMTRQAEEISALRREIDDKCYLLEQSTGEKNELRSTIKDFEIRTTIQSEELSSLRDELENKDSTNRQLTTKLEDLDEQLLNKDSDLSYKSQHITELETQISNLEQQIDGNRITIDEKEDIICSLQDKLLGVDSEISILNDTIEEHKSQIMYKEEKIESLELDVQSRDNTLDEVQAAHNQALSALQTELSELQQAVDTIENQKYDLLSRLDDKENEIHNEKFNMQSVQSSLVSSEELIAQLEARLTEARSAEYAKIEAIEALEAKVHNIENELETTRDILNASVANDFESVEVMMDVKHELQKKLHWDCQEEEELREVHKSTLATVLWSQDRVASPSNALQTPSSKSIIPFDKVGFAAFLRGEMVDGSMSPNDLILSAEKAKLLEVDKADLIRENLKLKEYVSALEYNVSSLTSYSHTVTAKKHKLEDELEIMSSKKDEHQDVYISSPDGPDDRTRDELHNTKLELTATKQKLARLYDTIQSPGGPGVSFDDADEGDLTAELDRFLPFESGQKSIQLQSGFSWGKGIRALELGETPAKQSTIRFSENYLDASMISNMSDVSLGGLLSPNGDIDDIDLDQEGVISKLTAENEELQKKNAQLAEMVSALEYQVACLESLSHKSGDSNIALDKKCKEFQKENEDLKVDLEQALELIDNMHVDGLTGKDTLDIFSQRHLLEHDLQEARVFIHSLLVKQNDIEEKLRPAGSSPGFRYELPLAHEEQMAKDKHAVLLRMMPVVESPQSSPLKEEVAVVPLNTDPLAIETGFPDGEKWTPLNASLDFNAMGDESLMDNSFPIPTQIRPSKLASSLDVVMEQEQFNILKSEYQSALAEVKKQKSISQGLEGNHIANIVQELETRVAHVEKVVGNSPPILAADDRISFAAFLRGDHSPTPAGPAPAAIPPPDFPPTPFSEAPVKKHITFASVVKERVFPSMSFFRTPKANKEKW